MPILCFLLKAQITRMWIKTALHVFCSDTCWGQTPIDASLQFKANRNIFRNERCKVTFGVEYIIWLIVHSQECF